MRHHGDSGASAVEFALVLPLLVILVFGIIEFGFAYWRAQGMEAAAREAGRVAAIGLAGSDVDEAARNGLAGIPIDASHVDICIEQIAEGASPGDATCVTATSAAACSEQTVRVVLEVTPGQRDRYGIRIPLVAPADPSYRADAMFRCELRN